ncbi:MAG TPA: GNAT family N-acetyltransferase [Anaerolineales bacterium]|nr:GNAT family N-acetyltransferase [Anaerolineales bacterium]
MIELPHNKYELVRPLLLSMDIHLIGRSILARKTPVQIFVDNIEQPRALFAQAGHRFILAGEASLIDFNAAIQNHFVNTLLPEFQKNGVEGFPIYYGLPEWEDKISNLLPGQEIIHADREYFTCTELKQNWHKILPEGFQVLPVNADLLSKGFKYTDTLKEEMTSERPSVEDFLDKSFGVCAIHENELAGWCLSEYNTDGRCEIGIETISEYRKRGLATALTLALLEHAFSTGLNEVGWHCFKRNVPSSQTARKAGLEKACDYRSFICLVK